MEDNSIEIEEPEDNDDKVFFYKPSLVLRVKSMLIDSVVIILLILLISMVLSNFEFVSDKVRIICMALVVFYEPVTIVFGGTIGQRMMGLQVINSSKFRNNKSTENINIFSSLIRYLFKLFLGWISLLTIHSDDYGRAIHDKVGNSIMSFK